MLAFCTLTEDVVISTRKVHVDATHGHSRLYMYMWLIPLCMLAQVSLHKLCSYGHKFVHVHVYARTIFQKGFLLGP